MVSLCSKIVSVNWFRRNAPFNLHEGTSSTLSWTPETVRGRRPCLPGGSPPGGSEASPSHHPPCEHSRAQQGQVVTLLGALMGRAPGDKDKVAQVQQCGYGGVGSRARCLGRVSVTRSGGPARLLGAHLGPVSTEAACSLLLLWSAWNAFCTFAMSRATAACLFSNLCIGVAKDVCLGREGGAGRMAWSLASICLPSRSP